MELSLTDLPTDVLLGVMRHADVPDLLACRLVCKRLGGLALHPDAWRHRHLHGNQYISQVLRLAPCLAMWELNLVCQGSRPPPALCGATQCAVTQLSIILPKESDDFELADRVIRNQAALGRLRGLRLLLLDRFYRPPDDQDAMLLATAVSTGGLKNLGIGGFAGKLPSPAATPLLLAGPAPSPSVKTFLVTLTPATEPFVSFVLAAHAATLEKVTFHGSWGRKLSDSIAVQLAGLRNLQELRCEPLPGLQAVAACKLLRHFSLNVSGYTPSREDEPRRRMLLDAEEFLRRADQLESVRLEYDPVDNDVGHFVLTLPARSRLQRLVIADDRPFQRDSDYPHLQPLVAALPSLTALQHLELNAVVDGLAGAVTAVTAPALRTLRLRPVAGRTPCAHAYLHSRSMATLLADNPALQVHVCARNVCLEVDTCEACRRHCHQEMRCIRFRWLRKGEKLSYGCNGVQTPREYLWINITRYNLLFP